MNEPLRCRILWGTGGELPDLRAVWQRCLAACPPEQHLFSFDWYAEWMRSYGSQPPWTGNSCVVVVEDASGVPYALLPLAGRRAQGLRYLSLAGFYQPLRSFPCVPATAEAACTLMVRTLQADVPDWEVLRFGPIDDGTTERAVFLRALASGARHRVTIPRGRTLVTRVVADGTDGAHTKTAKRIASYARRFAREPGATLEHIHHPEAATAAALFRELGDVERRSWLAKADGDLRFAAPRDQEFWQRVTATCLTPGGHLDVWLARLNGTPVAFRVVLSSGAASYMIANQYDEAFAEFRLGWILYLENLNVAMARGTAFIDAAPGDAHYKGRLGGEEAEMRTDEFVFRPTWRGWVLARLLGGLHATKERLGAARWGRPLAARLPRV